MPFGYSAIGGLLGQMEEAKRRMQQPLAPPPDAFQLPQQGMPQGAPMAPPLAPEPPSSAFANIANANISDASDLTHGHKRGIRGLFAHALGVDRVPKEVAALLTPDQVERVKPGVIGSLWNAINYGVGPQRVMQDRANNMLALQDKAANRKSAAEMARQRALIAADYETMPNDPVQRYAALTEMTARLAAIGHPDAVKYANILNAIKPDSADPMKPEPPRSRNTARGVQNFNPETRKWEYEKDENGDPVMPWSQPLAPQWNPLSRGEMSTGTVPLYDPRSGRVMDSGVPVADSGAGPSKTDQELAAKEAERSYKNLLTKDGTVADPPGNLDRVATQYDVLNPLASEEGQAYMNNVRSLIRSWAIVVEGKRMSDADARANEILKSFRFGNKGKADQQTKDRLAGMAKEIKQKMGGGGAASGAAKEFKLPDGTVFRRP